MYRDISSLANRAHLSIQYCNTVSLYTINNDYTRYNICSTWFYILEYQLVLAADLVHSVHIEIFEVYKFHECHSKAHKMIH